MAFQVGTKRPHQPNKTPAPNSRVGFVSTEYGNNGYPGRSSIDPGQSVTSPLADDLRRSADDGQDTLGKVIAGGSSRKEAIGDLGDAQQRTVDAKAYPTTRGCEGAAASKTSGGKPAVPSILDKSAGTPVRKPG
jgi:hypothetical protein